MKARKRIFILAGCSALSSFAAAQVPDLLNALDAGGRAMGIGGATQATDSNTLSTYYNPAGLAYITSPTFGMAFRNLPQSNTIVSGKFKDADYDTTKEAGPRKVTHIGFALPFKDGAFGFSYTMGGTFKDFRLGNNLTDGTLTIRNLASTQSAQTDFFTLAWAKRNGDVNYGLGLVFANQYISDLTSYDLFDAGNTQVGQVKVNNSGNSTGFGLIAGAQFPTTKDGKSVVGLSVRTPISLKNNSTTSSYLNKVPGRASLGITTRGDNLRGGQDFLVYGAQVDYFFGSDKGGLFNRKDFLAGGVGIEYNYHRGSARIPVRAGYSFVPSGGTGFQARNTFTLGVGYRPSNSNMSADLNFGLPTGGGAFDLGLSVTYKVGKN